MLLPVASHADDSSPWRILLAPDSTHGWQKVEQLAGQGEVRDTEQGVLLDIGDPLTMIRYTNATPVVNYEVEVEARKVEGNDFFCAFTFPVQTNHCSLVLGGWGGFLYGISCLDGLDASENETTGSMHFKTGHWYRIRVRVEARRLQVWLDDARLIDVDTTGRSIGMRYGDIEQAVPFGLASYVTRAEYRRVRVRPVNPL